MTKAHQSHRFLSLAVAAIALFALALAATATANASSTCNLYAATSGSDGNPGTMSAPFATVQKLAGTLVAGQTGCVRAGSYGSAATTFSFTNSRGTASAPVTITSYPGERANLHGYLDFEASNVTFSRFDIDGDNTAFSQQRSEDSGCPAYTQPVSQGLSIEGSNVIFQDNDLSQSVPARRAVAIGVGWWGTPAGVIIRHNRIHDVGGCKAFDHLIYVSHGSGTQVYDNWMWNDPHGWGVQIYPGATSTHVFANVIDTAGAGFVIGGGTSVSNNLIEHNVVMNSSGLPSNNVPAAVLTSCCGIGTGNVLQNNISWNNSGGIDAADAGISNVGNTTQNPMFVNPAAHDYTLQTGSPAASFGIWNGVFDTGLASVSTPPVVPPVVTPPVVTPPVVTPPPVLAGPLPVPPAPSVTVTAGNAMVTLKWAGEPASYKVTGYDVWRVPQTFGGTWASLAGTVTAFVNRVNENGKQLVNGVSRCYQVAARNATGEGAKSAVVCATPTLTVKPSFATETASVGTVASDSARKVFAAERASHKRAAKTHKRPVKKQQRRHVKSHRRTRTHR